MKFWLLEKKSTGIGKRYLFSDIAIVRAKTEEAARESVVNFSDETGNSWLDKVQTSCKEISPNGPASVILIDYFNG